MTAFSLSELTVAGGFNSICTSLASRMPAGTSL